MLERWVDAGQWGAELAGVVWLHLAEAWKLELVAVLGVGGHWVLLVAHGSWGVVVVLLLVHLGVDVWERRLLLVGVDLWSGELLRVAVGLHRVWVESLLEHLWALHAVVTHVDLGWDVVVLLLLVAWNVEALVLHAWSALGGERRKVKWRVHWVWGADAAGGRVGDQRWSTLSGELRVGRWRWKRSLEAASHWSGLEVRNHEVWWNVSLLLVDGWELLLVVGALGHALLVVHGVLGHATVLSDHLVGSAHWALWAAVHLGAALLVTSSAVLATVPPVLDCIVAATMESACDLSPALAHLGDHLLNEGAFLWGDGVVVEMRLEVLVVTLTTLLWRAGLDHGRDANPVVGALGVDEVEEDRVLGLGPWTSLVCRHCDVWKWGVLVDG